MKTRPAPWADELEMYERSNEVERLFRRLRGHRRIVSRFETLDAMCLSFVLFANGPRGLC